MGILFILYPTSLIIKNITKELENLFAESCQCKKKLQRLDQRQVQLVETLLGSDMGNLTRTMKKALNSSNTRVIISVFLEKKMFSKESF